jgi:hypothetical protein
VCGWTMGVCCAGDETVAQTTGDGEAELLDGGLS